MTEGDRVVPRNVLDRRATVLAKTLIRGWIADPSYVRLVLRPFRRPGRLPVDAVARLTYLYVLAELLRAG